MVSTFATDKKFIVEAWRHVMADTTISASNQEALLPKFITGHRSGDPRRELNALLPLREAEWQWPVFEKWDAEFNRLGQAPYMWEHIFSEFGDKELKFRLLCHTLTKSVFACRDGSKTANWHKRNGWRFFSTGCPIEKAVADQMKDQVDLDDWRTWPPFFPGDRNSLLGERYKRI